LPRHPIATEAVRMTLRNAGAPVRATLRRIDEDHANARRKWQELGSPEYLSSAVVEELNAASAMEPQTHAFTSKGGAVEISAALAPLSVTAITLSYTGLPVA
jgi:xylan 1,4-beta-xylosidase